MRVLHVVNGEFYAGAERVQDILALKLPLFGYEVQFACIKPGDFPAKRRSHATPLKVFAMRSRFDISAAYRIAEWATKTGAVLMHAHTPRSGIVAAGASFLAKIPLVYHVHSPVTRDTESPFRNRVNQIVESSVLRRAALVLTVSSLLEAEVRARGAARGHILVARNGVPCVERTIARRSGEDFIVGCVALFRRRKGVEVLLEAVAKLRSEGRRVLLKLIGGFETEQYEQELRTCVQAHKLADVTSFTGFTDKVLEQMQRIDCLALPSLYGEGLPMVVLEAMSVGTPVIATRSEGITEAIEDGVTGLLVAPGDPLALATGIRGLTEAPDRGEALGRRAQERQRTVFSEDAMAASVAAGYDKILTPVVPNVRKR